MLPVTARRIFLPCNCMKTGAAPGNSGPCKVRYFGEGGRGGSRFQPAAWRCRQIRRVVRSRSHRPGEEFIPKTNPYHLRTELIHLRHELQERRNGPEYPFFWWRTSGGKIPSFLTLRHA